MTETLFETPEATVTTELVEHKTEPTPMLLIERAIAANIDPGKLFDLAERWEANRAAESFGIAIAKFQAKCPVVHRSRQAKGRGNFEGYSYASYDDVMRAVSPLLEECGLALSFSSEQVNGQLKVTCRVRHGIHYEDHTLQLPVPDMRVNETQKFGAALSYAKRYALCAALNIVVSDEDNDAAGMMETVTEEQIATLNELIESTDTDIKRFLKWLAVDSLAEISADQFSAAIYELKRKASKK